MITVAHRIQLMPNNKQKTYFRKAIGCCRLAYNWGLAEWKRRYKEGERGLSGRKLRNDFNAIRGEQFPFTYEVTKYATAHAFDDLQTAYNNFFEHRADYPRPHRKKDGEGSFYLGNDAVRLSDTHKGMKHLKKVAHNVGGKRQYLNVPNLGYVKMSERLRFNGKLLGVKITQEGERFFASFQVQITEEEYCRTHTEAKREKHGAVGIDLGLKETMTLSDGIAVSNPRTLRKHQRRITRLSRQLSKRQHAKTKQERLQGVKRSNNYIKLSRRLGREQHHVGNIRHDFTQKLTTILTTTYEAIAIEDLNVKGMVRNHKLAKSVSDVAFGELRRQIESEIAPFERIEIRDQHPDLTVCDLGPRDPEGMRDRDLAHGHFVVHRPAHPELARRDPRHVQKRGRRDECRARLTGFGGSCRMRETRDLVRVTQIGLFGVVEFVPVQERHHGFAAGVHDADQKRRTGIRRERGVGEAGFEFRERFFRCGQTFCLFVRFRTVRDEAVHEKRPRAEHEERDEYLEDAEFRLLVLKFGAQTHGVQSRAPGRKERFRPAGSGGPGCIVGIGFRIHV